MKEPNPAKTCELCDEEASLYCDSDSAFLCSTCDARVHEANFLVARHVRQTLCCKCKCLTGNFISGERSRSPLKPVCQSCIQVNPTHSTTISSSSSSDCISSTESSAKKIGSDHKVKQRYKISSSSSSVTGEIPDLPVRFCCEKRERFTFKAQGIFVIWCKRLGRSSNCDVVSLASRAFELCLERLTALPKRVSLAASFWVGLRVYGGDRSMDMWQNLKRLEEVSGVPAKLIVAVERKLERVMRVKRPARHDLEEGWAESDCNARVARAKTKGV